MLTRRHGQRVIHIPDTIATVAAGSAIRTTHAGAIAQISSTRGVLFPEWGPCTHVHLVSTSTVFVLQDDSE
jgi:hypothetical protein